MSLRRVLEHSKDNEQWVAAIADWFESHELFFGHGTDNAADEAYWLLRHLQQWDDARWSAPARQELAAAAVQLAIERTRSRRPLAQLIHEAWFCGLQFYVDENVLVPRSPLAEIIERRFEPWIRPSPGDRLLDIGTGSGCLAIAAALMCPELEIDATDASAAALDVAARNVERYAVDARVRLHLADLYPSGQGEYRVIMSNPPYVPEADYAQLPAEYLHEPKFGLVGGLTGLEPAWQILRGAPSRLVDDGIVVLEVGAEAERLEAAVPGLELTWIEFERGGEGVCVVQGAALRDYLQHSGLPDQD